MAQRLRSTTTFGLQSALSPTVRVLDHLPRVLKVDGGLREKHSFDPRTWGAQAEAPMAARVWEACHQFGLAGRALAIV